MVGEETLSGVNPGPVQDWRVSFGSLRKGVDLMVTEARAIDANSTDLAQIGDVAGLVWRYLDEHGEATLSKLVKEIEAPRDMVMQGVGWLAREGKIRFETTPRSKLISLS
jgi:hypothetical protein